MTDIANQPTIMTYDEPETPSSEVEDNETGEIGGTGFMNGLQLSPVINIQPPSPMVLSPEDENEKSLMTSSENELDLMMTNNEPPQMCPLPPALSHEEPLEVDTSMDSDLVIDRPLSPTDFTLQESAPDTPLTTGDRRPPSPSDFTLVTDDDLNDSSKPRPHTASMGLPTTNTFAGSFAY